MNLRITSFYILSLAAVANPVEIPLWLEQDGTFAIDAQARSCRGVSPRSSRSFSMSVRMDDLLSVEEHYSSCEISISPIGLGETSFQFRDPSIFANAVNRPIFGIGPRSYLARQHGVDVISTTIGLPGTIRMNSGFDEFFSSSCYPGTLMNVLVESFGSRSSAWIQIDLADTNTGERFNLSYAPLQTILQSVGDNHLATIPENIAVRLDNSLVQAGAIRINGNNIRRTPDYRADVWEYTNCSTNTLNTVPSIVFAFYNRTETDDGNELGYISLRPEEYFVMSSNCSFAVGDFDVMPSLDVMKLPYINKRIDGDSIYLCESPIDM